MPSVSLIHPLLQSDGFRSFDAVIIMWQCTVSMWPGKSKSIFIMSVTKSKIALKPYCPVWGILDKAQVFIEPLGDHIVVLYETVHWVALSIESFGHGTDNHFGIAFPSVLWQSVQKPHGTVIIHQNPGHRLTLVVSDTTWWEVADEVLNAAGTFLISSKFPVFIHQVNMGKVKRWDPWFKLTVEKKTNNKLSSQCRIIINSFPLMQIWVIYIYTVYILYLAAAGVSKWLLSGKCIRCTKA